MLMPDEEHPTLGTPHCLETAQIETRLITAPLQATQNPSHNRPRKLRWIVKKNKNDKHKKVNDPENGKATHPAPPKHKNITYKIKITI